MLKKSEFDELKESLTFISKQLDEINKKQSEQQKTSKEFMKRILILEEDNKKKDERIQTLENKLDDMEQYSKLQNIVISGLPTRRQYADVVGDTDQDDESVPSLELQVIDFFNKKLLVNVKEEDLDAVHYLPKKKATRNIVIHS